MPGNALPTTPGKSFVKMFDLIYRNNIARKQFSDRLLIAIFWEESLFNNVFQGGAGTAVGFGQVEPAEFWKLKTYGLGLPPVREEIVKVKDQEIKKTYSRGSLSDEQAVKSAAALLDYVCKLKSRETALRSYAGYFWAKDNASAKPTAAERLQIINNWEKCADALADVKPFKQPTRDEEDGILDALQIARPFQIRREEFRPMLFRAADYA
jgi:hypothetical protein